MAQENQGRMLAVERRQRIIEMLENHSSVLIADLGSASLGQAAAVELATIALLANIVREMLSLFGTPLFARWGGMAPISAAGINSMDVCLPLIARHAGTDYVPQAILHGIALEVSVPLLIGLFC